MGRAQDTAVKTRNIQANPFHKIVMQSDAEDEYQEIVLKGRVSTEEFDKVATRLEAFVTNGGAYAYGRSGVAVQYDGSGAKARPRRQARVARASWARSRRRRAGLPACMRRL